MKHQTSSLQLSGSQQFWHQSYFCMTDVRTVDCRSMCTTVGFMMSPNQSRIWLQSGNISTRWLSMIQWCSRLWACIWACAGHLNFWMQTLNLFDILSHMPVTLLIVDTLGIWVTDLAKRAVTYADINRFHWNLVICLQLDIALLVQNLVKIQHFFSELWECI